ncbi:MAG: hypothetical protein ACHQ2E_08400 [Gemmatimonadales bacterium]
MPRGRHKIGQGSGDGQSIRLPGPPGPGIFERDKAAAHRPARRDHQRAERVLPGGTRATLAIEITGVLGPLLARLTGKQTDRYIALEAAGLRRRSEAQADPNPIPGPHDL